ncbi:MAG: hypothetical protein IPM69_18690 [Ignavibacteria bacterium]|nr:hypothetical protein [Ignavibacteria bacterium]
MINWKCLILSYSRLLALVIILSSCNLEDKVYIEDCRVITKADPEYQFVIPSLDRNVDDSVWQIDFNSEYLNHSVTIIDKKYKWNRTFASHYFDVIISSFTNKYVVLYAGHSGILNGYTLFPKWWHDIYVLDRKDGHVVKLIEIKEGLWSSVIYGNAVVMRFDDINALPICMLE